MAFNFALPGTIGPNTNIHVGLQFGSGDDHGAQYIMAMPRTPGARLQVDRWWKVRFANNTVSYWVSITNPDNQVVAYDLCGGGLQDGYNGVNGAVAPARKVTPWAVQFGSFEDRGAQFLMANPRRPPGDGYVSLASFGHTKVRQDDGSVFYWFSIFNESDQDVEFDVSGGGMDGGYNGHDPGMIAPTNPGQSLPLFAADMFDRQAQYVMANPVSDGAQLTVDYVEAKEMGFNRRYWYTAGVENPMPNAVAYDMSGGGME